MRVDVARLTVSTAVADSESFVTQAFNHPLRDLHFKHEVLRALVARKGTGPN